MFRYISFFVLTLFSAATLFAQADVQAAHETDRIHDHAPTKDDKALLWKISGKGLEADSWLFGTIHMIAKEDFHLSKNTIAALEGSDLVVFEINTEDMFDLANQFSLLMRAFMDNGTRLRDLLNEEEYTLVKAHFDEMGLPLALLERVKPMFLSVMASEDLVKDGGMMSDNIRSYEIELTQLAQNNEKTIDGLETAEFQMSMFDSIPYDAQAKMLVESIQGNTGEDAQFEEMVRLYKAQDLYGMEQMIRSESGGMGEYNSLLLTNRNRNWIPLMIDRMRAQPTFFAVGAGHLAGKEGVIALLRREGFTLEPVFDQQ